MNYSYGDVIEVMVDRESLEIGAGVGHMPDQTMVVVVGASDKIGASVQATVVGIERTKLGTSLHAFAK